MVEETKQKKTVSSTSDIDISNLKGCIYDSKRSFLDNDRGPEDSTNYNQLRGRLEASRNKFPPLYQEIDVNPYIRKINEIGEQGFISILLRDPQRNGLARLMLDIGQAIIQNGEGYNETAMDAFQEVVSDLYDGFLSAEDRKGVNPPDRETIPPIVKFGEPEAGPYTWPVDATATFDLETAVVNLPPSHSRYGILGWAALGHETAGHDILHADEGLFEDMTDAMRAALLSQGIDEDLTEYWTTRIDETASDCLGILNMGPMAGIGLIGYFRGINDAFTGNPKLRNEGSEDDPHPVDILRGYVAAYTVRILEFDDANKWSKIIESETDKDLSTIIIGGKTIDVAVAKKSAEIVALVICTNKFSSLENHSLDEIQNWRQIDQIIVNQLMTIITTANQLPTEIASGIYAAHAVAASVQAALTKDANIEAIFSRMLLILKTMHDSNPTWGPLFIKHPGNVVRELISSYFSNKIS